MKIIVLGETDNAGPRPSPSSKGHWVSIVDSFARRQGDHELGVQMLTPIRTLREAQRSR